MTGSILGQQVSADSMMLPNHTPWGVIKTAYRYFLTFLISKKAVIEMILLTSTMP